MARSSSNMDNFVITAASRVTEADLPAAKLIPRFGRLDLASQLAVLAVESLGIDFDTLRRDRVGICLAARAGSLATDVNYWSGRDNAGGPSPTLFAYTLPSSAIGEIAIRHRLTGPNLCWVGGSAGLIEEAVQLIRNGEAEACLCVEYHIISPELAAVIQSPAAAWACALFVQRGDSGHPLPGENHRDIESWCDLLSPPKRAL